MGFKLSFNPADTSNTPSFSNGNSTLTYNSSASWGSSARSFKTVSSGKWYFEAVFGGSSSWMNFAGIVTTTSSIVNTGFTSNASSQGYVLTGLSTTQAVISVTSNGSTLASATVSLVSGDVIGCAVDLDNNLIYFSRNGTWLFGGNPNAGTGGAAIAAGNYMPFCGAGNVGGTVTLDAIPTYASPTGFSTIVDPPALDPAFISANVTLSNGNLTGTNTVAATDAGAFANISHHYGKYIFSATYNVIGANTQSGVGIGNASASTGWVGGTANGLVIDVLGGIYTNTTGSVASTMPTVSAGSTVWVAVDVYNRLLWYRVGTGNWNNNASANPDTGVGGLSISGITGDLIPCLAFYDNGDQSTIDLTAAGNPTSTFLAWSAPEPFSGALASSEAPDTASVQAGVLSNWLFDSAVFDSAVFDTVQKLGVTSRAWTPLDAATMPKVWLDANSPTNLTISGSSCTGFSNPSGSQSNGGVIAFGSATYSSTGWPYDTTKGYLDLTNQSSNGFNLTNSVSYAGATGNTVFALGTRSGDGYPAGYFGLMGGSSSGSLMMRYRDDNVVDVTNSQIAGIIASTSVAGITPVIAGASFKTNSSLISVNGTQTTNTTDAGFTAPITQIGNDPLTGIGTKGKLAEIILFDTALSASDFQKVEGYLAWKWGIQSYLPVGHPYASAAPTVSTVSPATGTLSATEAADTASFAGSVSGGTVSGSLASTEALDVASFAANAKNNGSLASTEATDTASFAANFKNNGSFAVTEAQDTAAASGQITTNIALGATEAADAAAFNAATADNGSLASTEAQDTAAFNILASAYGSLAATEGPDVASFSSGQVTNIALASTEAVDTASFAVQAKTAGSLASAEAVDTASFAANAKTPGALASTEAKDSASFAAQVIVSGSLAASELPDTAAIAATISIPVTAQMASSEAPDTAAFSAAAKTLAAMASTEAPDTVQANGWLAVMATMGASERIDTAIATGDVSYRNLLIKYGGTWTSNPVPYVNHNGVWVQPKAQYVKTGGVWKQVWGY